MKLIAMMIVRNELSRYLRPVVKHLLDFCDEIRVVDDNSTDGTAAYLERTQRVELQPLTHTSFYEHEGRARQRLLEWTMQGDPTHILAIDGDEFVSDGKTLRATLEQENQSGVWGLNMQEVWKAEDDFLSIRQDHAWHAHRVGICFAMPHLRDRQARRTWRIPERQLACGRVPTAVIVNANRTGQGYDTGVDILHFGWANENDRADRYQRYVTHDSGQFHNNRHLESIMWPDAKVGLTTRGWPATIDKAAVLKRATR